jgi:Sec1 family
MPEDAYQQPVVSSSGKGGSAVGSSSRKSKGAAASLRKGSGATSRWTASNSGGGLTSTTKGGGPTYISGPRIIVFIVGGASYSELRVCRDITEREGREVIIGSTSLISAEEFIEDLKKLQRQSNA